MQCDKGLDFGPLAVWPDVLPPLAWQGFLLCGFSRARGEVLELGASPLIDVLKAAYPELALGEMARLQQALRTHVPAVADEFGDALLQAYNFRPSDRLQQCFSILLRTPSVFQKWVDEKRLGARDLASLLALDGVENFAVFLTALVELPISKSDGVRALELGVELFLLGRPLNDLLPSTDNPALYLMRLEKWRRPLASESDQSWREDVEQWPWPAHTQGVWQRFGDEAGLEIKIRTTSPQDFLKKLERLQSIRETWSCKS
jgi:hypothetical protein